VVGVAVIAQQICVMLAGDLISSLRDCVMSDIVSYRTVIQLIVAINALFIIYSNTILVSLNILPST